MLANQSIHLYFLKHKNQEVSEVSGISLCQEMSYVNVFLSETD